MAARLRDLAIAAGLWATVGLCGCDALKTDRTRFLSPEKVIRNTGRSPINPILPSVGAADEGRWFMAAVGVGGSGAALCARCAANPRRRLVRFASHSGDLAAGGGEMPPRPVH